MFSTNNHEVNIKRKITVILAGTILASGFTLPASANESNRIAQQQIGGQPETLVRTLQGNSQKSPTVWQNGLQFQLTKTCVGNCVVPVQSGSLQNGDRVDLQRTNVSQGNSLTKIIDPIEGYVARTYLKNCRINQRFER